jgi:midasin
MTFLDGLGSVPQLSTSSPEALRHLRSAALSKLHEVAPLPDLHVSPSFHPSCDPAAFIQLGPFAIPRGARVPVVQTFDFQAPTTQNNAMRVVRACQVAKPILLEGSPGVGKTSLISALANIAGHVLYRINLSDQTDLTDLFGSDLPVEGGGPGEFSWKEAGFLMAMRHGHWVLLDEMNLAPQAVLEGLNAVLDHRGSVFIPELGRSFTRHPSFRIFAAQNPLHQGGGRKGLPKSFLNRFTKVYLEELAPSDLFHVCEQLFPSLDPDVLRAMIAYNSRLAHEVDLQRSIGRDGSPWEFNLRDVIRWGTLTTAVSSSHPSQHVGSIYIHRFRTAADRSVAGDIFNSTFAINTGFVIENPHLTLSSSHVQIRHFHYQRSPSTLSCRTPLVLRGQLAPLETIGLCMSQSWLVIVTGTRGSGKNSLVRTLASLTGNSLREVPVNCATDTMDILGGFEQVDDLNRALLVVDTVLALVDRYLRTANGSKFWQLAQYIDLQMMRGVSSHHHETSSQLLKLASDLLDGMNHVGALWAHERHHCQRQIEGLLNGFSCTGRFEWVDGPLVTAIKQGTWILLDGANLCSPSVLDRLNSLCEMDGVLTLNEKGYVDGDIQVLKPHPNFRLFMTVDPQYGELSRAMRNRGVEICLIKGLSSSDLLRLQDYLRLPIAALVVNPGTFCFEFETIRRGLAFSSMDCLKGCWPSGHAFVQDSSLSALLHLAPAFFFSPSTAQPDSDGVLHVLSRLIPPTVLALVRRFLIGCSALGETQARRYMAFLSVLQNPVLEGLLQHARRRHQQSCRMPPGLILVQVSD